MNRHMSYYDMPVMLSRGFTFGIADSIMWGMDRTGLQWQAVIDGEWVYFGKRRDSGGVDQHERMSRDNFDKLFA